MTSSEVFIIDDDYDMRELLSAILQNAGYRTSSFTDGHSFVRLARGEIPACLLLDICMPGQSGIEILKKIDAKTYPAPILIVSGRNDVLTVVEAMRNGAFDYIEKPLTAETIVAKVAESVEAWNTVRSLEQPSPSICTGFPGYQELTRRERDVLFQIAGAASNKEAAINLGISPRTVEIHRSRIMHKLGAKNSIDLMRIVTNMSEPVTLPEISPQRVTVRSAPLDATSDA